MYNKIQLIGRWIKDPEYGNSGTEYMNCALAVNDDYKKEESDLFNVVAFKGLASSTANFTKKGSKVFVEGKMRQEEYEKDGETKKVWKVFAQKIVFLDNKKSDNQQSQSNNQQSNGQQNQEQNNNQKQEDPFANNSEPIDISDDDLPF